MDNEVCGWERDGWLYETDCGNNLDLPDNSCVKSEFKYCPFCGAEIEING